MPPSLLLLDIAQCPTSSSKRRLGKRNRQAAAREAGSDPLALGYVSVARGPLRSLLWRLTAVERIKSWKYCTIYSV